MAHAAFCDGKLGCWGKHIVGTRYKCLQCLNTDYCERCAPLHTSETAHLVLPIPTPLHEASSALLETLLRPLQMVSATVQPWRGDMRAAPPAHITPALMEQRLYPPAAASPGLAEADALVLDTARLASLEALHARAAAASAQGARLDPRFFRLVGCDSVLAEAPSPAVLALQAYYTLFDTVLLYDSARGYPIAAMQVMPAACAAAGAAPAGAGAAVASALLYTGDVPGGAGGGVERTGFQALFSDEAHIAYVFTNLLPDAPLIFFLSPCASDGTHAGSGETINGDQVVSPGASYVCSANAAGRALMVQRATDAAGAQRSYAEDRARAPSAQIGACQRLDVRAFVDGSGLGGSAGSPVPLAGSNYVWRTADNFLRAMAAPAPPRAAPPAAQGFPLFAAQVFYPSSPPAPAAGAFNFFGLGAAPPPQPAMASSAAADPWGSSSRGFSFGSAGGAGGGGGGGGGGGSGSFGSFGSLGSFGGATQAALAPPAPASGGSAASESAWGYAVRSAPREASASASAATARSAPRAPRSALLDSSTVARLGEGDAVAGYARGAVVERRYQVEPLHSAALVVGLSVQPALVAREGGSRPCYGSVLGSLVDKVRSARAAGGRISVALPHRVFPSQACVVCLDPGSPPDCVFAPCGHQCAHFEEAATDTCYVCRASVSARLCVRGGVVVAAVQAVPRPAAAASVARWAAAQGPGAYTARKPVSYLYPVAPTECTVSVELAGGGGGAAPARAAFTYLLPAPSEFEGSASAHAAQWRVRALPGGTLAHPAGEAAHPAIASLFWESSALFSSAEAGLGGALVAGQRSPIGGEIFCMAGSAGGAWLLRALARLGLSPAERTDMATYWGVLMARHAHVAAAFVRQEVLEARAPLRVAPQPARVLRVFLCFRGVAGGELPGGRAPSAPPALPEAVGGALGEEGRAGAFWAVEWGGAEY